MVGWRQPSKLTLNGRLRGSSASGKRFFPWLQWEGTNIPLSCIKHKRKCLPVSRFPENGLGIWPAGANKLPLGWLWSSAAGPGTQDLRPSEDELQRRGQKTNSCASVISSQRQGSHPRGRHGYCPGSAGLRGSSGGTPGTPRAALSPLPGHRGLLGAAATCGWADSAQKSWNPAAARNREAPCRPSQPQAVPRGGLCSPSRIAPLQRPGGGGPQPPPRRYFRAGGAAPHLARPGPSSLAPPPPSAAPRAWPSRDASAPLPAAKGPPMSSAMSSAAARVGTAPRSIRPPGGPGSLRSPRRGARSSAREFYLSALCEITFCTGWTFPLAVRRWRGSPAGSPGESRISARRAGCVRVTTNECRRAGPPGVPCLGLSLGWRAGC